MSTSSDSGSVNTVGNVTESLELLSFVTSMYYWVSNHLNIAITE